VSDEKKKKNYIKYTPEQLAAVPSPAQKEGATGASAARSMGVGAVIGAVAGTLVGIPPATGALVGGTAGVVNETTKDRK